MLAYNTSQHSTTKVTPFFANKGFEADISLEIRKCKELVPYIKIQIEEIHKLQNKFWQNLTFFNKVIKRFADKKRV